MAKEPATGPYAFRYVLRPWPEGQASNPKVFFDYNAEAVAERDASTADSSGFGEGVT